MARKGNSNQVSVSEFDGMFGKQPAAPAQQHGDEETAVSAPSLIHPMETLALVTRPIKFAVSVESIAVIRAQYAGLPDPASGDEAYEANRKARAHVKGVRVEVEDTRKELKADALRYERDVDARAKVLREALEAIEDPIAERIKAVDQAKERARWEVEHAVRLAEEEKARQERAAEEARRKTEREAEEKRLAEQRAAQDAKDKELREAQAALDAEKAQVAAAQRKIDEANQAAAEAATQERKEQEDRDRAARVERERLEREQAEREKAARMAPDADKLRVFAAAIRAVVTDQAPELASPEGGEAYDRAAGMMMDAVEALEMFGAKRR